MRRRFLLLGLAAALFGAAAFGLLRPGPPPPEGDALDPVPAACGEGRLERSGPQLVLRLAGTPEEMGRQHGTLLRRRIHLLLDKYLVGRSIVSADPADEERRALLAAARAMRPALAGDLLRELDACAAAAGVDPDLLLLAQCEGDLREAAACSAYAAFGPATKGGRLEVGRNLDWDVGGEAARSCALVTYRRPSEGLSFAAVGFAGILTGWTLVNERGLVVANHLGGGFAVNPAAVPTLLLQREAAARAATVEEGIALLRRLPRMRGQIIWMAQEADPAGGRPARAAAVEYDAERVAVREAEEGVLIVTNTNRCFRGPVAERDVFCPRYRNLREMVNARFGLLDGRDPLTARPGVANSLTLHIFTCVPAEGKFEVRHGALPAQSAPAVSYRMP